MCISLHIDRSFATADCEELKPHAHVVRLPEFDVAEAVLALRCGGGISAQLSEPPAKPGFVGSGFIGVKIDLAVLPLHIILAADFTQAHAAAVLFPKQEEGVHSAEGNCLALFKLETVERDQRRYAAMVAGIEAKYEGSIRTKDATHVYEVHGAQDAWYGSGQLDEPALLELIQLGKEAADARTKPDDLLRSRIKLQPSLVVRLASDDKDATFSLEQLHPEMRVFCPMHIGREATAVSFRSTDGRPVLACGTCQHTYTCPDTSNQYDFGMFDRVVRELAASEIPRPAGQRQFDVRSERFLGPLPLISGVLCVKSPKGSGKTERLAELVECCKQSNQRVLLLGHRRTLLTSMSRRLGLECYIAGPTDASIADDQPSHKGRAPAGNAISGHDDQIKRTDEGNRSTSPTPWYAVSLDSLCLLKPHVHKYDVILVDESEQLFAHLVGSTLKAKRKAVYHRLRHYLRVAKSVVLLDADLGMVTMDSLFYAGLKGECNMNFILNEFRGGTRAMLTYPNPGQLMSSLLTAVSHGEKCFVATNSKRKAIDIEKQLAAAWPERRVVVVHADNSSDDAIQALLSNVAHEFEHRIDVLIASPALGTGIDISFRAAKGEDRMVVDHVFGLFQGNITTHSDMDQQLARVRHPRHVHVWVDPQRHYYETDVAAVKDQLLRTVAETQNLLGYSDDGKPIEGESDGLEHIWARVRAANRGSRNRLADLFLELRKSSGWHPTPVAREEGQSKLGSAALQQGKDLRVEEHERLLLAAPVLEPGEVDALKDRDEVGAPLTVAERAALGRAKMEAFYADQISPELIAFDGEGRMRQAVRQLEVVLAPDQANLKLDHYQDEHQVWIGDRGFYGARSQLLRSVLAAAGVYDLERAEIRAGAIFDQATLGPFVAALISQRKQFESVFGIVPRADADKKRVLQLVKILELVGLKLGPPVVSDAGGARHRTYALDPEHLQRIMDVLQARAEAREEAAQHKAEKRITAVNSSTAPHRAAAGLVTRPAKPIDRLAGLKKKLACPSGVSLFSV